MKITCASCGVSIELPDKVGFRDTCPSCDAYFHSCVNCAFWINGQCTEPAAEKVRDPEGINFCDWYKSRAEGEGRRAQEGKEKGSKDEAEEMWRKLMKNKKEG